MTGRLIERYVTAVELAEVMGVSHSTVKRWTAAGMPSETWGMKRTRRYQPSLCVQWARNRAQGPIVNGDNVDLAQRVMTAAPHREE